MFKKASKIFIFAIIAVAVFGAVNFAFAQSSDFGLNYANNVGLGGGDSDPRVVAVNIVRIALTFLGIIATIIILYGGFLWMTSAGDSQKMETAKKTLINAVIGLVIIMSAFLIVSWVLNQMQSSLGGTSSDGTDPGDGGEITQSGESFSVLSKSPGNGIYPINTVVRYYFSRDVDADTVSASSFVLSDENGNVNGTYNIAGRYIEFIPSGDCPQNDCGATRCFEPGQTINVNALNGQGGILDVGGTTLSCGLNENNSCDLTFNTSDQIDCAKPSVAILSDSQLCLGAPNQLGFSANDDSGVSQVEFKEEENGGALQIPSPFQDTPPFIIGCDSSPCGQGINWWTEGLGTIIWQPEEPAYSAGRSYAINATASDLDSNTASAEKNFVLRAAHCCNNILDENETGIDCGGQDCASCSGAACGNSLNDDCASNQIDCNLNNNRCASDLCECSASTADCQAANYATGVNNCCLCQNAPRIDSVSPAGGFCRDGAGNPTNSFCAEDGDCQSNNCDLETANSSPGGMITINGRFFGNSAGTVTINGELALNPQATNSNCQNNWSDNQILVVVPANVNPDLVNSAKIIVSVDGRSDSNMDNRGSIFNFIINQIARPGICALDPLSGSADTAITYHGLRFNNSAQANFGNTSSFVPAFNSVFVSPERINAVVPNLNSGRATTFILNGNGAFSNYFNFEVIKSAYSGPYIISFSPVQGRDGQYVTISGGNFGNASPSQIGETYRVFFFNAEGNEKEADYEFPAACSASLWTNNQIIVKAPDLSDFTDSNFYIKVDANGKEADTKNIVRTGGISPLFLYDSSALLAPGLCKISPVMGVPDSEINFIGEYFDAATNDSAILFYRNERQSGSAILNWEEDAESGADEARTTVPATAITGPVKVSKGSPASESNGLNFSIGSCLEASSPDDACGVQSCCPVGTYNAGYCVDDISVGCYPDIKSSVFEWGFSTGLGVDLPESCSSSQNFCVQDNSVCPADYECNDSCVCVPANTESCSGLGSTQCFDSVYCPNSPGRCSASQGGVYETLVTCDYSCSFCSTQGCVYRDTIDRCVVADSTCREAAQDVFNDPVIAYCEAGKLYFDTYASCPTDWIKDSGGKSRCQKVGAVCSACATGSTCQDYDNDGDWDCVFSSDICPDNSICQSNGECQKTKGASCECCCEVGQSARDCCPLLECSGECGSGTSSDGASFGYCTGCADAGSTAAEQDAACNCSGASGKYCDTSSADYPQGVCRDCGALSTSNECSTHSQYCCVDNMKNSACRGVDEDESSIPGGNGLAYCPYYDCTQTDPITCENSPDISGTYKSLDICSSKCGNGGSIGGQSCFDESTGNCGLLCSNPYSCIGESGCAGGNCVPNDTTCSCCCDTSASPDSCTNINSILDCREAEPCAGGQRGLCCGCSDDSQCAPSGEAELAGCGRDTCCRARPNVVSVAPTETAPTDNAVNICRNAIISVEFDQKMDVSSFSGNIIIVGDYGADLCPDDTTYISLNDLNKNKNKFIIANIFSRLAKSIYSIFPIESAVAYETPDPTHNFCAITGATGGYNNAAEHGILEFKPNKVLDGDRRYYVIVKGDKNLDSSEGVKNYWGIGMNGNDTETMSGAQFSRAHISMFTTMPEQARNNGVCEISRVEVNPSSYLFQTTTNDLDEIDTNPNDSTFDTARDRDKLFIAQSLSANGQKLVSLPGVYSWIWDWSIGNEDIVKDISPAVLVGSNRVLIQAVDGITDWRTSVSATANVVTSSASFTGQADVYVFICDNPWPPIDSDGFWSPWKDASGNCNPPSASCGNTNYEIYYCRDAGVTGTYDDLPAILSGSTLIKGKSEWRCRGGFYNNELCADESSCAVPNVPTTNISCVSGHCQTDLIDGGTCAYDADCQKKGICDGVFKEAYYFRESVPVIGDLILYNVSDSQTEEGDNAAFWWDSVPDADSYVIYYGKASGSYSDNISVSETKNHSEFSPYYIFSLEKGATYYFVISAKNSITGAESELSSEISVKIQDTASPVIVNGNLFKAVPGDKNIDLDWSETKDATLAANNDLAGFRVFWAEKSATDYANKSDIGLEWGAIISDVKNGVIYKVAIAAYDTSGNFSEKAELVNLAPFATPSNPSAKAGTEDGTIDLNWTLPAEGVAGVIIESRTASSQEWTRETIDHRVETYSVANLNSGITYYFRIKSFNQANIESAPTGEVSVAAK
ncbi:MAG: fibronectin type III domain-containing protein [bacterium]